jgi:hypothetical protein
MRYLNAAKADGTGGDRSTAVRWLLGGTNEDL